jgi:methionyl-tRNA formyltransferase
MKVILSGKNTSAVECLELLAARGDEVLAIPTRGDDGTDGWQRSLKGAARRLGARIIQPPRINAPESIAVLADFGADVLVSIQYDQILKGPLFAAVGCPCLNIHFALLPRHRGVAPIAWAVMSGDVEAGVTLHHMIEDIDAGDVVAQKAVRVPRDMTARELYDALSVAAVDLFRASLPFAPSLLARRIPQDPAVASYHRNGDFDFSQRTVDWSQPADALHRWIRAMIFPPFQHPETALDGNMIEIARIAADVGPAVPAPPGTIVEAARGSFRVAAGGGTIVVASHSVRGGGAVAIAPGRRLGAATPVKAGS